MASAVDLGQVVITLNARDALSPADVIVGLDRHRRCDWGELCPEDWAANNFSLREGNRLLSSYTDQSGVIFWIITEADRSATTVLLPGDY